MKKILKKAGSWLLYAIYLGVSLAAIDYFFFYRPLVKDLRSTRKPKVEMIESPQDMVPPELMERVGWIRNRKKSSFTHFDLEKPADVVRICAFGDSFTEGDEVGDSYDFPTLLQRRLDALGARNAEVINFGSSWWGFHQSFLLWKYFGKGFDCDFIALGPQTFYPRRDTSFNHTDLYSPYNFHARYVLWRDSVRLVEVEGRSHEQRFDNYYRFVPRLRYLRYDRNLPLFLLALLPEGRTLSNPFYYFPGTMDEESQATYKALIGEMAESGSQVLLSHYSRDWVVAIGDAIETANLAAFEPSWPLSFPHRAPRGHNSAWGNDFLARQYLAHILEDPDRDLPLLKTEDLVSEEDAGSGTSERIALSHFESVQVELREELVGHFGVLDGYAARSSPTHLKESGVVSLLSFQGLGESVLDGCFVPLEHDLEAGTEVFLRAGGTEHLLGTVRLVAGGFNLGVLEAEGLAALGHKSLVFKGSSAVSKEQLGKADTVTVLLGKKVILQSVGREGGGVRLSPVRGSFRYIRASGDSYVDLDELESTERFELVARLAQGGDVRIPIATWEKTTVPVPPTNRSLERLLALEDGRAVLVPNRPDGPSARPGAVSSK